MVSCPRWRPVAGPIAVLILLNLGCDKIKEQLEPATTPAAKPTAAEPKPAEPTTDTWCKLTFDERQYVAPQCGLVLLRQSSAGAAVQAGDVLQVATSSPTARHWPDVFLQAKVEAAALAGLLNKPMTTACFVKTDAAGPVARVGPDDSVELRLTKLEDPYVEGSFGGYVLVAGSDKRVSISGTFRARAEVQ